MSASPESRNAIREGPAAGKHARDCAKNQFVSKGDAAGALLQ